MIRRNFLQTLLAVPAATVTLSHGNSTSAETLPPTSQADGKNWYNLEKMTVEGRAWENEERISPYDRFPKRWMEQIPDGVRGNSRHSSGMACHFRTNSRQIWLRYENTSTGLGMWHMAPVGVSGFDLYCRDDQGKWRYLTATQKGPKAELLLEGSIPADGKVREFLMYFPLYNGVKSVEVGVAGDSLFELVVPKEKPILFYGTSICHGACASRPGMPHPAVLARRLDLPFWNFGFSGCGRMELIMADAFAELDPCVYVLDCLPNMNPDMVAERAYPFVRRLREKRPDTPIILIEDRRFPRSWLDEGKNNFHNANHAALRKAYDQLIAEGEKNLYYIEGDTLLPEDGEGTVDNSHPNDYGFWWHANAIEPTLRKALNR